MPINLLKATPPPSPQPPFLVGKRRSLLQSWFGVKER